MSQTAVRRLAILFIVFGAVSASAQESTSEKPADSRVITGRVVNESGQPLAGVNVAASRSGGVPGQRTSTDSEGYFKLQGLDPGLYRIFASSPGYIGITAQTDLSNPNLFYRPGDSATLTLTKGGVIAGVITNINGDPVVNVSVRAYRVRDAEGNKLVSAGFAQPRMTDDRGYYRIYGLQAGTYIVAAGGQGQYFGAVNPFASDAPTYAPASTRDTATEFVVRSDQEVTADIRYRGEPGHAISGRVTGSPASQSPFGGVAVRLSDLDSHAVISTTPANGDERVFQINGVSDGEYEISAMGSVTGQNDLSASSARRITVKGADVTGLELTLTPMASVAGRINFELDDKLNCGRGRTNPLRETLLVLRRDRVEDKAGNQKSKDQPNGEIDSPLFPTSSDATPNEKGEINLHNLSAGTYRFEIRTPGAGWYFRDLSLGPANQRAAPKTPANNIAANGLKVKAGEKISDVTITIAEGGAGLRGRLAIGEGQSVPPGLRVYLLPVEKEQVDNALRFFEGTVAVDGTFAMGNIAPGRYWIIAQPAETVYANGFKSIKTDSVLRARILRDAEAARQEISFKPCERTLDYQLSYNPAPSKN